MPKMRNAAYRTPHKKLRIKFDLDMCCVLRTQLSAGRLWFVRCLDNQVNNNHRVSNIQ